MSKSKLCKKDGCNEPVISRGKYCLKHKSRCKKCQHEGCTKIPCFNYITENKVLFCSEHKKPNMVDVKNKKCIYKGCTKRPNFNNISEKIGIYCSKHKRPGMINVTSKKCQNKGCTKQPSYNSINENIGIYCSEHKLTDMIDVKNKKCQHEGCTKIPSFNNIHEFNRKFCNEHKLNGMVDIKHKKCKSEWCDTYANKKYDGYCAYCYCNIFPDSELVRNYKTKEKTVVDFILETFSQYTWINDKRVIDACSKRRPDLLVDFGEFVMIIEVDENCHRSYDTTCENKRLMEISQDLGHRPLVIIRMNTDGYVDAEGTKIKSCWSVNKTSGLLYINNKKQWNLRLERLKEQVEYWIENKTDKTLQIVYLFYDE